MFALQETLQASCSLLLKSLQLQVFWFEFLMILWSIFIMHRFCHDEAEPTHSLDRKKVEEVECLKCNARYWISLHCYEQDSAVSKQVYQLFRELLSGSLLKPSANSVGLSLVLLISAEYAGSFLVLSVQYRELDNVVWTTYLWRGYVIMWSQRQVSRLL